ncbi:MAG: biotin--[acetyl-CoA-carboxylase] ligase [Candidatus Kapabacteria bacterium]|nr:biotin--[acetyl-CoA-carboxylase] ligase [Candidatus Kapabacteria bacterium]
MKHLVEFHLPRVTSTNDYARTLIAEHDFVMVTALFQTAGRGRNGRQWIGDHGANIYASFGITHHHALTMEDVSAYMARGALSVYGAITNVLRDRDVRLKYPNDVQVSTVEGWAKIAGILVEHEFHGVRCASTIVGMGVNVEQEVFPETITQLCTSLRRLGISVGTQQILSAIRDSFVRYCEMPWQNVHREWVEALRLDTVRVTLSDSTTPHAPLRVMHDGRLVLRNEDTQHERIISDGDTLRYLD